MNKTLDAQFIENMHDEIISAFNSYDLEKLLGMHTDDIVVMEQNRPIISGKEEVKKIFTKAFDHVRENKILFNLSFQIHELEVWGNRAFARGQVNRITRKADGSINEEHGKYLCL